MEARKLGSNQFQRGAGVKEKGITIVVPNELLLSDVESMDIVILFDKSLNKLLLSSQSIPLITSWLIACTLKP
ncbi:hypothetical protein TcWFU_003569 [Taenia crassiceps]|uniref:Uncharacterized protein n=1 Tax=Taenia crassiceps TaxID=6207 RepID=A0ABR4QPQ9_9CEST